ncbi:MAG: hypothetical protein IPO14_04590 [Saprospiraceae bacterium]|nr:hypothetical protein [Saprospiraceae bacterium]
MVASGGGTYVWNTTETTESITVTPTVTTTYTVEVTGTNGCKSSDEVVVTKPVCTALGGTVWYDLNKMDCKMARRPMEKRYQNRQILQME